MPDIHPFVPSIETAHLPAPGGTLAEGNASFRVIEIPLYEPTGEGTHWYVRLQKDGWTTKRAAGVLAKAAGVSPRDVGFAGMKDRHAVTEQWISVLDKGSDPATWQLPEGLEILRFERHRNKLRTGHLKGNRFELRFTGMEKTAAEAVADWIRAHGVLNAYGAQRFGTGLGNIDSALSWLLGERRAKPFEKKLYPSVIQSEYFNRYAVARLEKGTTLIEGEWVGLAGSGSEFIVEDPAAEQARLEEGDIELTGPMPGRRVDAGTGPIEDLFRDVCDQMEWWDEIEASLFRAVPGARRRLRVSPGELTLSSCANGDMVLGFDLPSGSFATQVAREFTRLSWDSPLRAGEE